MNKKLLVVAIAGALSAPSAFAATDTSGMQYTSASEGFYASIRLRYDSGSSDNAGAGLRNSDSRIGVGGSNDLGGGLEGFYQWEMAVATEDGDDNGNTRVARVGLRGEFGQVQVGSFWTQSYNMVYGSTDVASVHSGSLGLYDSEYALLQARSKNAIEYTSPDLNGFQGALMVQMQNTGSTTAKDDNDIDLYMFTAKYEVQGFTVAGNYVVDVDGIEKTATSEDDHNGYGFRLGYTQDNWYVNGWYGKDNESDDPDTNKDREALSLAAGVAVGKVDLYAVYETVELPNPDGTAATMNATQENDYSAFGVVYNLGSRSRVWVEYAGQDLDTSDAAEDYVTIGLRHDF